MQTLLRPYSYLLVFASCLSGCASPNAPSHLPTIWDVPGMIGSTFTDAVYRERRQRVSAYVQANYAVLRADGLRGGGSHLDEAMRIAAVKPENTATVRKELQTNHAQYFPVNGDSEPLVVLLMVHS